LDIDIENLEGNVMDVFIRLANERRDTNGDAEITQEIGISTQQSN